MTMETLRDYFQPALAAAAALRGLGAGIITGVELITLPARRRLGPVAYATFVRAHFRGGGVKAYAGISLLGALLTAALSVAVFLPGRSRGEAWRIVFSLLSTLLGFVGTAGAYPAMRRLWQAPDDDADLLASLLDRFARWGLFSAIWHAAAFVALVAALAEAGAGCQCR